MELKIKVLYTKDCEDIFSERIQDEENRINFSVYNMTEYPEDATISRELFSAKDYINALNKGIELAQKGYKKIIGEWEEE